MMSTTTGLMTAAELLEMPSGNMRQELVKGELRTMAPAGYEHGTFGGRLATAMGRHALANDLGDVLTSEAGFCLSRNPDTVRAPDVAFVCKARIPNPRPKGFFQGSPDIAVEIISPGDTLEEVEDKVAEYLEAGTVAVWVLNPRRRTVSVHSPDGRVRRLQATDLLEGGDVFPGFSIAVSALFC